MIDFRGPYRLGAFFIAISAILHILAIFVGGVSSFTLGLVVIGIVYLGFAYGLLSGWRWMAYLTFLIALIGSIVAFGSSFGAGPVPGWWWTLIVIADVGAVITLFAALWRGAPEKALKS